MRERLENGTEPKLSEQSGQLAGSSSPPIFLAFARSLTTLYSGLLMSGK